MQQIKAQIPNLFTLGNLFCGCLALVKTMQWDLYSAALLVFLAAFLDFFDGFFARLLKVSGELGKQLDSLADVVSFGLVPGMIVFQLMRTGIWLESGGQQEAIPLLALTAFIIPLLSAYRLAKFNIDSRQTDSFIGLPTPANALLFVSFPLIMNWPFAFFAQAGSGPPPYTEFMPNAWMLKSVLTEMPHHNILLNPEFLLFASLLFSFLLVSEIPLFALKFKSFSWKGNVVRYLFLSLSAALLIIFHFLAIPFILLLYITLSILNKLITKS